LFHFGFNGFVHPVDAFVQDYQHVSNTKTMQDLKDHYRIVTGNELKKSN